MGGMGTSVLLVLGVLLFGARFKNLMSPPKNKAPSIGSIEITVSIVPTTIHASPFLPYFYCAIIPDESTLSQCRCDALVQ
jgi:hypothetical protein